MHLILFPYLVNIVFIFLSLPSCATRISSLLYICWLSASASFAIFDNVSKREGRPMLRWSSGAAGVMAAIRFHLLFHGSDHIVLLH